MNKLQNEPADVVHDLAVEVRSLLKKPQGNKREKAPAIFLTEGERKRFLAVCEDLKLDEPSGMLRAIREFIRNNPLSSERFVGKRHFAIPHGTFILVKASGKDLDKLQGWLVAKNRVELASGHANHELWIINETLLEKARAEDSKP